MAAPVFDDGARAVVAEVETAPRRAGDLDAETVSSPPEPSAVEHGPSGPRADQSNQSVQSPDGGIARADEPESLQAEEHESDPRSEMITVEILVDPPKHPRVFWGPKDLGAAPLQIRRPRGSAPLDLVVRAPGYLTVHTRAFCDRDDKLSIHLVPLAEAPRMLGYRAHIAP